MQMDTKDKFRGVIVGLAVGDCLGSNSLKGNETMGDGRFTEETQQAICVCESVKTEMDEDGFSTSLTANLIKWFEAQKIPEFSRAPEKSILYSCSMLAKNKKSMLDFDSSVVAARACPVGMYFYDHVPQTIQYARASCLVSHSSSEVQVASVASSLLTLYAMSNVPTGVWGDEVISFASGIDNDFADTIREATNLASNYIEPSKAAKSFLSGSRETVALALYSCMITRTFKDAILCCLKTGIPERNELAAIVGACCGAKYGIDNIPIEWKEKIEDLSELIKLADKIFDEKHSLSV